MVESQGHETASQELQVGAACFATEQKRHGILLDSNRGRVEYRQECVHRLFEEQAARTPDAVAAIDVTRQINYAELNAESNAIAQRLQSLGVGPEVMVGISIDRSIEMLVALIGILKAGGAFVPLDISLPGQRIEFMLRDMDAPILLCSRNRMDRLSSLPGTKVLAIEDCAKPTDADPRKNPVSAVRPDSLAYMLYTSGSTGQPKGVLVTHRALANYLAWCADAYPVNEGRGTPVHSPDRF